MVSEGQQHPREGAGHTDKEERAQASAPSSRETGS